MKRKAFRLSALLLALALLLPPALPARAAEDSTPATASVDDILVTPSPRDGHLDFGEAGNVASISTRDSFNVEQVISPAISLAAAIGKVCDDMLTAGGYKNGALDYLSYISVSGSQGAIYDGYNNEGDTGAGVAGIQKYYYSDTASNYRVQNILFVPSASFNGQALVTYYGYYHHTVVEDGEEVVKQGTYAGRIYITVGKQVPGISYSTDGEPVRFSSEDFVTYSLAVTGRTFRYITFTLPSSEKGSLYYNYLDSSIYDAVVAPGSAYYRSTAPTVSNVYFVPKEGYAGTFLLAFTGADIAGATISGEINITVTNYGPSHTQPRVEGPFVYEVLSGRSVSLHDGDTANNRFEEQCKSELGVSFLYFRFTSLPSSSEGTIYDDSVVSGSARYASVGTAYTSPANIRFAAASGFSGVVSVPIVITGTDNSWFDAMLRFVVTKSENTPLRYTVEPESRVNFIASDFADACYAATGYDIQRIHFDALPPSHAGSLYCNGNEPVNSTANTYYYKDSPYNSMSALSFLANAGFTGSVDIPFTGYAYGYSSSNGRLFNGVVTVVSAKQDTSSSEAAPIGGTSQTLNYYTNGIAVYLNPSELLAAAATALSRTPAEIYLSRPRDEAGKLCLDFVSLSHYNAFNHRQPYTVSDLSRVSFLPKSGFSGTEQITYTAKDDQGNSFTGNIRFHVAPPTRSSYFSDMTGVEWAIPAVDFFRYYGATNGTSLSNFSPNLGMRRGDFILLLSRAFTFQSAGTASFDDVPQDKYYAAAIASAKALGIVTGEAFTPEPVPGQTEPPATQYLFRPDEPIKREDAALYLYRALLRADMIAPGSAADLARFPDGDTVSADAAEAMGALVRDGVFQGYVVNLLPQRTLSRAETITILYRALT